MPTLTRRDQQDGQDDSWRRSFWNFVRTECLILLVAYAATVLISVFVMAAWAPIMGWFGFIYLVAAVITTSGAGLFGTRGNRNPGPWMAMLWLAIASVMALVLTSLYAATIVPLYSGTRTSQLLEIQFFHSAISTIVTLIVGVLWHFWMWRKAARSSGTVDSNA